MGLRRRKSRRQIETRFGRRAQAADNVQRKKSCKIRGSYSCFHQNVQIYNIIEKNAKRLNQNAKNIEKIAIVENYTVADKVKVMFKELIRKKRFVFNNLFALNKCNKKEVVTAFSGLLELSRRSKVTTNQQEIFGDILVEKVKKNV